MEYLEDKLKNTKVVSYMCEVQFLDDLSCGDGNVYAQKAISDVVGTESLTIKELLAKLTGLQNEKVMTLAVRSNVHDMFVHALLI